MQLLERALKIREEALGPNHSDVAIALNNLHVRHWQSGTIVLRWTAAGVLQAERGFRKVAGYCAMPILVALRSQDAKLGRVPRVDDVGKAA